MIAEGRNLDAKGLGGLEDRRSLFNFNGFVVNSEIHFFQMSFRLYPSLTFGALSSVLCLLVHCPTGRQLHRLSGARKRILPADEHK